MCAVLRCADGGDFVGEPLLTESLEIYLRRRHVVLSAARTGSPAGQVARYRRVLAVVIGLPTIQSAPPAPNLGDRFKLVGRRTFRGAALITVFMYSRA